jgi:hypothetical protein
MSQGNPFFDSWGAYSLNSPGAVDYGQYAMLQALLPRGPQRDILAGPTALKPAPTGLGAAVLTLSSGAGTLEVSTTVATPGRYIAYNDGDSWVELAVGAGASPVLIAPFETQEIVTTTAAAALVAGWQDSGLPWGRPFRVAFDHATNRQNSTWDAATFTVRKSAGTVSWADHYQHATNAAVANASDALAYIMPATFPWASIEVGFGGGVNVYTSAINAFRASNSAAGFNAVQFASNGTAATPNLPPGAHLRMGVRNGVVTQELLIPGMPPRMMHMWSQAITYPMNLNISFLTPGQMWGPLYAQRRAALQLFNAP